jgi:hypothetical protein
MSDNIEKKVLVSIDLANSEANSAMEQLAVDVKKTADELKNLKAQVSAAKAAMADANAEYAKEKVATQAARTEYQKKRTAILEANQALKASKQATQAANGSYAEAQQKLTALGKAIKNTENGFNSSNPAIQKQIQEYNQLNNQLKKFDAQMGNHQRNVGNYESALSGLGSKLGSLIPGFNEASEALKIAAQGFNAVKVGSKGAAEGMGEAATGAEAAGGGVEGLGAGLGALASGLAIVAVLIIAIAKHFADLTPNADALGQRFAYLKGLLRALAEDNMDQTFGDWASSMHKVAQEAANIKEAMQDLNRSQAQDLVDDAKADAQIADLMLKMRNRRNTPEQERAYFNEIQKISVDKYKGNKELADKEYELAVRTATNSNRFTQQEIDNLRRLGVAYAIQLDKQKGLVNGADDIKAIVDAQQKQIATEREMETVRDRAQNRLDASDLKAEAAAEKAKNDLIEAKRAGEEIENERRNAIAKMLQDEMEGFARELSMNDEQYRQKLFKLQDFIKKQEQLRNKTKSPEAKAQFTKNIASANALRGTDKDEHAANQEKLVTDYFKKQADLVQKGQDELTQLQIANIRDVQSREIAALDQQHEVERQAYTKQQNLLSEDIAKVRKSIKTAQGSEKTALQDHLNQLLDLQGINQDKSLALDAKYEHDKAKLNKDYADRETQTLIEANLIRLKLKSEDNPNNSNDKKNLLAAEKDEALNEYNVAVSQEGVTNAQKVLLHQEYLAKIHALDLAYNQDRARNILQWERTIQDGATSIIKNAISSNAQYAEASLNRQRTFELNNQALTKTQQAQVEERFRIKQGQEKVKEFRANQKLAIAQALINGALAMTKTTANVGFPLAFAFDPLVAAQTAIEIAAIAAQKPPAYAIGGIHSGDGLVKGPGTGTSDSVNAKLSNGEAVINAKSTSMFAPLLSAINQAGGGVSFDLNSAKPQWLVPHFASGGVYTPSYENNIRPISPMQGPQRMHPDDISQLGDIMMNAVYNMPNPVVDVREINHAQGVRANTLARVEH